MIVPPRPTVAVGWRMVETVYAQPTSLAMNVLAMAISAGLVWLRGGSLWPVAWGGAAMLVLVGRWLDFRAFARRPTGDLPSVWARRFTAGAWAVAALWGAASAILLTSNDKFSQLVVISVQAGFLAGAAARNNAVPAAALGQVLLTLLPLLLVCLVSADPYFNMFAALVVLQLVASVGTVHYLHSRTVQLLVADAEKMDLLQTLGAANEQLAAANRQLQEIATTDGLTGIPNRRSFDISLAKEWRRAIRGQTELALLLVDIDFFKPFNDHFGHQAGDDCLRRIAACIAATVRRPGDLPARYGGEEFAIILPETDRFGAIDVAEKLRGAVAAIGFIHPASREGCVTVSIGVATARAADAPGTDAFVACADRALYLAKQDGRNCVRCAAERAAAES